MSTIYDIAEKTGVSPSTVSRALAGSRLVREDVRVEVEQAARQLGYRRRTIRRPRERAILNVRLVLPRPAQSERGLFYDMAELADGLQEGFGAATLRLALEIDGPSFSPFAHKKGGDTDAFVFAFHEPSRNTLRGVREAATPCVVLNRWMPGIPCLATDHEGGFAALLAHLREGGQDLRPAYLGLGGLGQVEKERRAAFLAAAAKAGLPRPVTRRFASPATIRGGDLRALIDRGVNAFCAVNDIVGIVVLEELRGLGARVPEDVAVTGFDASPVRALTRPLLTTFSMPVRAIAIEAGRRLAREVIERRTPEPSLRLTGELIPGESTHHS